MALAALTARTCLSHNSGTSVTPGNQVLDAELLDVETGCSQGHDAHALIDGVEA